MKLEEKVLEMHGFSGLEGVSDVIRRNVDFGGPIEEKVSDLGGLEGLESLEMGGFSSLEAARCYPAEAWKG